MYTYVCIKTQKCIYLLLDAHVVVIVDALADQLKIGDYIRGSLNKFPDFFRMGTFIDSTHMKLKSPSK